MSDTTRRFEVIFTFKLIKFKCDLCDTDYIGYTTRHLHQRIEEHRATAVRRCTSERLPGNFKPRASEAVLRFKEMPGKA